MISGASTRSGNSLHRAVLAGLLLLFLSPAAAAQEDNLLPYQGRLPEDTLFILSWKGAANFDRLRSTNPLLRLLGSPEMKANWQALEDFYQQQEKQGPPAGGQKPEETRHKQEIPWRELAPLLSNAGLLAVVLPPQAEGTPSPRAEPAWLLLYDSTGKEEALAALETKYRDPKVTFRTYEFEGVGMTETVDASGKPTDYAARLERWVVYGNNKEIMQAWIQALRAAPARSLKDVNIYQRTRALADPNSQLEAFLNIALISRQLERVPAQANSPSPERMAEALGLNDFEAGILSISLEAARARYQVVFTPGAAASGQPILGPAVREFPSLGFAPAGTAFYSVAEINLAGVWARLQEVLSGLAPPGQARLFQGFVAMGESVLGMKVDEMLAAWGTELATISYSGGDGKLHSLRAFALRDRERVLLALANLQQVFGENVRIEEMPSPAASEVKYLQFSARAPAGEADAPPPFLYATVSPQWALLADERSALERALRPIETGQGLRDNPVFQQARSRFPAELTGFSFADAEKLLASPDFAQWLEKMAQQLARGARQEMAAKKAPESSPPPTTPEQPLAAQTPEIPPAPEFKIPKGYLKWLVSATSRDARGLFFTGTIE